MLKKLLLASCGAMALGGCSTLNEDGDSGRYDTRKLPTGQLTSAPFNINEGVLDKIDLLSLIDPENRRVELQSQGLCQSHNAAKRPIEWTIEDPTFSETIRLLKEDIRATRKKLLDESLTREDRQTLRDELLQQSIELRDLQFEAGGASLRSREGQSDRTRSMNDIRRRYVVNRYNQIVEILLDPEISTKDRKDYEDEKEELEKEAKELGQSLDIEGDVNPSIELNCAVFAFYTYYLSYPQFKFAINDLSFWLENPYLDVTALPLDNVAGNEFDADDYIDELEGHRNAVEAMSEYEQARLKAYLATGLYDKFFHQAARSVALSMRRNAVQDQIMLHSENYCRYYKAVLHDMDINVNFALGTLSTVAGGLATIFTDPTTVRALAGAAAVTSGVQSRFNEVMFSNLAIQTVIAGMDVARENTLRKVNSKRFFPLNEDDMQEFESLPNDGVLNPGMFNTFGLRASIPWDHLYGEQDGMLTYAGAPVELAKNEKGINIYQPPIFTFSDLVQRVVFEEAAASAAAQNGQADDDKKKKKKKLPPIANPDLAETTEDKSKKIEVLKNDVDPNEDADGIKKLTIKGTPTARSGTVKVSKDKTFITYTPNPNFHGVDVIDYTVEREDLGTEAKTSVAVKITADGNEDPPAKKYLGMASVGVYTVEAALRDAIKFQSECSLAAGLTAATESLKEVRAPSVKTLTDSLVEMEKMMKATEALRKAIDDASVAGREGRRNPNSVPSSGDEDDDDTPNEDSP